MQWIGLTARQIDLWRDIYPDVDVVQQLKFEMMRWLDSCVKNGKVKAVARKKDWKKFITKWLSRAQARALNIL